MTEYHRMSAEARRPASDPGGIDLNPVYLDLKVRRDGNGVPLPLDMQPLTTMPFDGLVPVIIEMTPVSVPMLLGMAEEPEKAPARLGDRELGPADRKARFEREQTVSQT